MHRMVAPARLVDRIAVPLRKGGGVLAVLLVASLAGCGDNGNTPSSPPGDTTLQMPFAVGDRWEYREVTTVSTGLGADTTLSVATLVGTRLIDGAPYYTQVDSSVAGTDTTYARQTGSSLYLVVDLGDSSDPVARAVLDILEATLPWRLAEFGAPASSSWSLASIDTVLVVEGSSYEMSFDIEATSRGTEEVTVPAGSWSGAQRFLLHLHGTAGLLVFMILWMVTVAAVFVAYGMRRFGG
ncbi:MAG: hypothetical protein KC729_18005, partial [Candidatus Eisenbacteria bacterium]|nr:hypothetical protein [Candidatus Eisenbacteria bacterium]